MVNAPASEFSSGRTEGTDAPARDDGRGVDTHADAWGGFDLGDLPPATEWQLRWFGFDTVRAA